MSTLTRENLDSYRETGFILCENRFTDDEVTFLSAQADAEFSRDSPARIMEKDGMTVRGVHGAHLTNETFAGLVRDPRIAGPAVAALGGPVYVHQFKINAKRAMRGDIWPWHQDYTFWNRRDGMRDSLAVNVALLLDEATDINGPLLVLPGSHRIGMVAGREPNESEGWADNLSADLDYAIDAPQLAELTRDRDVEPIKGRAGEVFLFDPLLVHGSGANMSPHDRRMLLVTYNRADNLPGTVANPRPEYLAARDYTPIEIQPWSTT